jgi:hypothetical protein
MAAIIAATGPDGDAIDLNLDTPEIRLGLASLRLALWAHGLLARLPLPVQTAAR